MVRSSQRFQSQARMDGILHRPSTPRGIIMKIDRVLEKTWNRSPDLPSENASVTELDSNSGPADGCSVLVVEDHPINRKLAVILLKKLKCRVVTAINGKEALVCMKKQSFDIVLMDLHMPVMDGFETARRIRQRHNDVDQPLLVALTAAASLQDRALAKASGLTEFLMKPVHFEQLEKLIKRRKPLQTPLKMS